MLHTFQNAEQSRKLHDAKGVNQEISPWRPSYHLIGGSPKPLKILGMFRLLVPMSKWNRSHWLGNDFDNIRTIVAQSKVEGGWSNFVQEHGNLFYVGVDRTAKQSPRSSNKHEMNNNHSGSKSSPRRNQPYIGQDFKHSRFAKIYGQSSEDSHIPNGSLQSESAVKHNRNASIESSERRSKNHSLDYSEPNEDSDHSKASDSNVSSYSKYLDSDSESAQVLRTPLHFSQDSYTGASNQGLSKPGKRKSFYLTPNSSSVDEMHTLSGIVLCEKLFGVILYQYNQRPSRPNGSNTEQLLRERKVIVQGVVPKSEADTCGQIFRGDMLVGLNDVDVTWVNIDDIFKLVSIEKVKLTFQVPLVIGPKVPTPPHTPTRSTPPLPPHNPTHNATHTSPFVPVYQHQHNNHTASQSTPPLPPHFPTNSGVVTSPPPRPPPPSVPRRKPQEQNLVAIATGESISVITNSLRRYPCSVMYLTFAGQTENAKEDIIYQFPHEDNKLVDIRGLYMTLSSLMNDVTHNTPKVTTVKYRGTSVHTVYWRDKQDLLLMCLPADRVPDFYLLHIMCDILQVLRLLFGGVSRVFQDTAYHSQINQLIALTLHRVLIRGVTTLSVQPASPLEPLFLDMLSGVRWLRLTHDSKISCDEILSEFEAADFAELEEEEKDERRTYGIIGSCLFFKDFLLCSHLFAEDLSEVHLFLKYHCILNLVNKQPVEELVIWREVFLSRLCHNTIPDNPGFVEPAGRRFLLVTGFKHFLLCTVLEAGGYASQASGTPGPDPFFVDQAKATLIQLETEEVDIEECCQGRLFSEMTGPRLQSADPDKQPRRGSKSDDNISPVKSQSHFSPRNKAEDETDRSSLQAVSQAGSEGSTPVIRRQGSKMSYGSNDSTGSNSSLNVMKGRLVNRAASMYDMTSLNRSFTENSKSQSNIKLLRGENNHLYHYVCFDLIEGLVLSPSPCELTAVQGPLHQHLLYNFYSCAVRIRNTLRKNTAVPKDDNVSIWKGGNLGFPYLEEGVMFSCQTVSQSEQKRATSLVSYWVVGRLCPGNNEMFVCFQDGTCQAAVEAAFNFSFGVV